MSADMAQRIKALRHARGLTLEQVADVVGVGKSTVRKWETGMIANMRRDKIALLAKALSTTPAYLMGWVEETEGNEKAPTERQLSEGQRLLLDLYDQLPEDKQRMFIEMLRAAAKAL
jgi:transcriptional regulator with XRE-family HTH domain